MPAPVKPTPVYRYGAGTTATHYSDLATTTATLNDGATGDTLTGVTRTGVDDIGIVAILDMGRTMTLLGAFATYYAANAGGMNLDYSAGDITYHGISGAFPGFEGFYSESPVLDPDLGPYPARYLRAYTYDHAPPGDSTPVMSRVTDLRALVPTITLSASDIACDDTAVTLTWNENYAPAVPNYKLWRGGTVVYEGTATSFEDTGLSLDTAYAYTVEDTVTGAVSDITAVTTEACPIVPPEPTPDWTDDCLWDTRTGYTQESFGAQTGWTQESDPAF